MSSLRHLDLAYNLLLEHAQLAPLSLLHGLTSVRRYFYPHSLIQPHVGSCNEVSLQLNLEGNPLYYQKSHRTCTVPHLSPKAVSLRVRRCLKLNRFYFAAS